MLTGDTQASASSGGFTSGAIEVQCDQNPSHNDICTTSCSDLSLYRISGEHLIAVLGDELPLGGAQGVPHRPSTSTASLTGCTRL